MRGILARLLRAQLGRSRHLIQDVLEPQDYQRADLLLLVLSRPETDLLLQETRSLTNLAPFLQSQVWYRKGRLGGQLGKILGPKKLPILSPKGRYASLIMIKAHRENHMRDPGDTLFRSQTRVWIVRGRALAKRVVSRCRWCKGQLRELLRQRMADLPPERCTPHVRPFTHISLDFLGPQRVNGLGNSRVKMKVFPILFRCLVTGALHAEISGQLLYRQLLNPTEGLSGHPWVSHQYLLGSWESADLSRNLCTCRRSS